MHNIIWQHKNTIIVVQEQPPRATYMHCITMHKQENEGTHHHSSNESRGQADHAELASTAEQLGTPLSAKWLQSSPSALA